MLDAFEVRQARVLLDHTVARFLWWATADAEFVALADGHGCTAAAGPTVRHLFETTHDVMHLIGVAEDRERFAAGTLVGEVLDWDVRAGRLDDYQQREPSLADEWGFVRAQSADEAFEMIANELDALGQDTTTLRTVYSENRARTWRARGVHCTSLTRVALIETALQRFADGGADTVRIVAELKMLWGGFSARGLGHSSPAWTRVRIEQVEETGRLRYPNPAGILASSFRPAHTARNLLAITAGYVEWYLDHRDE